MILAGSISSLLLSTPRLASTPRPWLALSPPLPSPCCLLAAEDCGTQV